MLAAHRKTMVNSNHARTQRGQLENFSLKRSLHEGTTKIKQKWASEKYSPIKAFIKYQSCFHQLSFPPGCKTRMWHSTSHVSFTLQLLAKTGASIVAKGSKHRTGMVRHTKISDDTEIGQLRLTQ